MGKLENVFSWSNSRNICFKECKRKYYYSYYGSWSGWEYNCPNETRQIYILNKLKSRFMWAGSAVHDAVSDILGIMKTGLVPDKKVFIEKVREKMQEEFKSSKAKNYWKNPKTNALFEHEYSVDIHATKWHDMWDLADDCISHFFDSEIFKYIQTFTKDMWLPVEEFQNFQLEGNKINVKLDFPYKEKDGSIIIIDWKTGKSEDKPSVIRTDMEGNVINMDPKEVEGNIQLACYALFANSQWKVTPDKIKTMKYNLYRNEKSEELVTQPVIDKAKDDILVSIKEMKDMLSDIPNNKADIKNFPRCEYSKKCNYCNFSKICILGYKTEEIGDKYADI